jgi:hypothetical protein
MRAPFDCKEWVDVKDILASPGLIAAAACLCCSSAIGAVFSYLPLPNFSRLLSYITHNACRSPFVIDDAKRARHTVLYTRLMQAKLRSYRQCTGPCTGLPVVAYAACRTLSTEIALEEKKYYDRQKIAKSPRTGSVSDPWLADTFSWL